MRDIIVIWLQLPALRVPYGRPRTLMASVCCVRRASTARWLTPSVWTAQLATPLASQEPHPPQNALVMEVFPYTSFSPFFLFLHVLGKTTFFSCLVIIWIIFYLSLLLHNCCVLCDWSVVFYDSTMPDGPGVRHRVPAVLPVPPWDLLFLHHPVRQLPSRHMDPVQRINIQHPLQCLLQLCSYW